MLRSLVVAGLRIHPAVRLIVVALLVASGCSVGGPGDAATESTPTPVPTSSGPTTTPTPAVSAQPDFADSFARVSTGVYRVDARYCDGSESIGTAFLLSRTLLLTALHVTGDATEVVIGRDRGPTLTARIVGTDQARDLALLEVDSPMAGHTFTLGDDDVRVGDEVAALGHPRGLPLTFTSGRVSAVGFQDGGVLFHQTDAPVNPGNSGGPLIDATGQVIGIADWKFTDVEGISFVVAAAEIAGFLDSGMTRVIDTSLGCEGEPGENFHGVTDDAQLLAIEDLFDDYAALINAAMEGEAYDRFAGPRLRSIISRPAFIEGNSTSILEDMSVYNVFWTGDEAAEAWVTFVSYQDPEYGTDGQSCSVWDLTYDLVQEDDEWKIDRAQNESGSPAPC